MLSIVPTPIGHLRDITLRALDVLKEADIILCEDTRRTKILLDHHGIARRGEVTSPLQSFHEHTPPKKIQEIVSWLKEGKKIALVSDGGTPLVSDPGFELVREVIQEKLPLEVLPGANAILTALAGSGLAVDSFSFFGFLTQKSAARRKILTHLQEREETLIFYESPFRLLKALEDMKVALGDREAVVAREMTKKFEEFVRGRLSEIIEKVSKKKILGEIVILVAGKGRKEMFK